MKVLGIIGRSDLNWVHDGSAALVVDNEIVYSLEQERLTRKRYAEGQGAVDVTKAALDQAGLTLSDIDYIAYGWHVDLQSGSQVTDNIIASDELTHVLLPPDQFDYDSPPPIHFVQHHYTHAASTYYTSGFDSAAVLVIDGTGEGESISLYHAKGNEIELLESYPADFSLGEFYSAAAMTAGLGGTKGLSGLSGPGKLMGLAPFGQVRQEIDFNFDAESGQFSLPAKVQSAIDQLSRKTLASDMGKNWFDYFGSEHYPFAQKGQHLTENYLSVPQIAHLPEEHIAHYVDLAATVQNTLERVGRSLVERAKKLTGESNLVLSGGVALNCTMNAYLSQQKIFDNLYVFPAANDAGASMGAALAVSYAMDPPAKPKPRLLAPAFGDAYADDVIAAAIDTSGLSAEKLPADELAERVAEDLANHNVVAWFRGKDEFGPRALGRRSFLANPGAREMLATMNTIKDREHWRPLAPSILAEEAETVLSGSMEPGLHRYMLGVATIRPEWRQKLPALVHVDYTCRPHFVEREHDGAYWEMINAFYQKTGIPLVCNTSLNVGGQPLVHTPTEVLELFVSEEGVNTLVIENYYLTKQK